MSIDDTSLSPILQALLGGSGKSPAGGSETGSAATGSVYCAQGRLALEALDVAVDGCGALGQPIAAAQAQALHTASAPAPFGHRETTVHDARVRDTGRIAASALQLRWAEGAQAALQAEVARALDQPALQMQLHDLLVYGPGQFFKPHQDTEKHPAWSAHWFWHGRRRT